MPRITRRYAARRGLDINRSREFPCANSLQEAHMAELSPRTRNALLRVGTSTLTGVLSRRGLRNMFLQDVWPIRPDLPRMVGLAFTMRFSPSSENKTGAGGRGPLQQQAMEQCPPGHVLV